MTGRKKTTDSKSKLPEVPANVVDIRNNKQYKKGDFLGKVSGNLVLERSFKQQT